MLHRMSEEEANRFLEFTLEDLKDLKEQSEDGEVLSTEEIEDETQLIKLFLEVELKEKGFLETASDDECPSSLLLVLYADQSPELPPETVAHIGVHCLHCDQCMYYVLRLEELGD